MAEKFALTKEQVVEIANSPAPKEEEKPRVYSDQKGVSAYAQKKPYNYAEKHFYFSSPEDEMRAILGNPGTWREMEKRKKLFHTKNRMEIYWALKQSIADMYYSDPTLRRVFGRRPNVFEYLIYAARESNADFDQYEEEIMEIVNNPRYYAMICKLGGDYARENPGIFLHGLHEQKEKIFTQGTKGDENEEIRRYFGHKEPTLEQFLCYYAMLDAYKG